MLQKRNSMQLVSWSLTSLFSTNMAISETKQHAVTRELQLLDCAANLQHHAVHWKVRCCNVVAKMQHYALR